jgi:rhamnopyranosyl-N-acetylglucosaminyl-diphospho-decaprenol beta-1,3/1,4-galactofuranosyltransferase
MIDLERNKTVAVVLHYNATETLFKVITGIKSQTAKVEKIVVVDNASEVNVSDHFRDDEVVKFIRLPTNQGVGAGHNFGWRIAIDEFGAELIWSLEHDTIPKPDCLEKLIMYYQPGVLAAIGPIEDDGLDYDHKEYYVFHSRGLRKLTNRKKKEVYRGGMSFNGILIPTSLLQRIGFLNEDFFVGREDFDFFKRIYKEDGYVLRVPQAQVFHNLYKENRHINFLNKVFLFPNQSITREYYSYRNSVYMSKRQNVSWMRLYFRHLAGLAITLLFRNSKFTRIRNRIKAFRNGLEGRLGK